MAQAVTTFRAFGAENPSFDTTCVARVISIQSRFAEVEKVFCSKSQSAHYTADSKRNSHLKKLCANDFKGVTGANCDRVICTEN